MMLWMMSLLSFTQSWASETQLKKKLPCSDCLWPSHAYVGAGQQYTYVSRPGLVALICQASQSILAK